MTVGTQPQEKHVSHPKCHGPEGHVCQKPSGRGCIDCGKPAGTLWGPYWCPDCDVKRLDKISASLATLVDLASVSGTDRTQQEMT